MDKYEKILEKIERLQRDLMTIDNYDEEVYQSFENLIFNLQEAIDEQK